MEKRVIVVHYDEISMKGRNRDMFEKKLASNVKKQLLAYTQVTSRREYGRILFRIDNDQIDNAMLISLLEEVPGIANFSIAKQFNKGNLSEVMDECFTIVNESGSKTFAIRVKRSDKSYPKTSTELEREVGGYVYQKVENMSVNLTSPDVTAFVEIGYDNIYVYSSIYPGISGLPVGTAGRMLTMLSGGIDSPVAAYLMNKRGVEMHYIHFMVDSKQSIHVQSKIDDLVTQLSRFQGETNIYIVPFSNIQKEIIRTVDSGYRMLIYRRMMMRIANRVADTIGARALVTGDSLSQVASQTIYNLESVQSVSSKLVIMPLIGFNKVEIINIAKKIGTYDISILPYDDCCSMFISRTPATKSYIDVLDNMEKDINIEHVLDTVMDQIEHKIINAHGK